MNAKSKDLPKDGLGKDLKPPFSNKLATKEFTMRFSDFKDLTYRFNDAEELEWSEEGTSFKKEYCQITEFPDNSNLFFVASLKGLYISFGSLYVCDPILIMGSSL